MKRLVVTLVALIALFTFIRESHGNAATAQTVDQPVVRAQFGH